MELFMTIFILLWSIVGLAGLFLCFLKFREEAKNGKIKKFFDKRKEKKEKQKLARDTSKQQIKKHNKKKDSINYNALKFEYGEICQIVKNAFYKTNSEEADLSEVYIIKFDEYFKKKNSYSYKFEGMHTILTLACLIKSIVVEPIIKGVNSKEKNLKIQDEVIEEFSKAGILYKSTILKNYKKEELMLEMQENYQLYNDDVFFVAIYLIEKLFK